MAQTEGRRAVAEAFGAGCAIEKLFICSTSGGMSALIAQARERKVPVNIVPKEKLDSMSQTGAHQGVIALCAEHEYRSVADILSLASARGEKPFVVALDGIEDERNLGAILRCAEGAGAHGVVLPTRRSAGVGALAVKTSAGASQHIAVARVTNLRSALDTLKHNGLWVYGADERGGSCFENPPRGAVCLVFGAEGAGLSDNIKKQCDGLLSIPMRGKVKSLNVSAAAAVIMYCRVA